MTRLKALLYAWLPSRPYRALALLTTLVGAVLCFVPLFDMIGYESAAFFGVWLGVLVPFLTLHAFGLEGRLPLLDDARQRPPGDTYVRLAARHLGLLVPPFVLLALNASRVTNCDPVVGALFWLAIPVVSVLIGQALAFVALAVAPGRRRAQVIIVVSLIGASAVAFGLRLALEPPIIGYQVLLGYFSGSIYDEGLTLPPGLVWYRLMHLFGVVFVLLAIDVLWRRSRQEPARTVAIFAGLALLGLVGLWWQREELGIDRSRGYIAEELGGRLETEHFVIYYPLREPFVTDLPKIAEDHEFRYAELEAYFGTDPVALYGEKVRSFVYPNREEKGALMGARRTLVAKIWLREIHILWREYGDHLLAHELAHVFSEPFGRGPLRVSARWGVGVNMGLVEGLATAADWAPGELTPHEASAALRRLELAPDIRGLVGASGFWRQASGLAYTLMGSFVRYLVDTYGIEPFKRAYGAGEFEAAYGKPADALVAEWERYVDAIALSDEDLERARYRYARPSIFDKVCARTIGELEYEAGRAARRGEAARARELYEEILRFAPNTISYRIRFARFLNSIRDFEAAEGVAEELLELDLNPVERAEVLELLGDAQWHVGELGEARASYDRCLEAGLPLGMERFLQVKAHAVTLPELERQLAFDYLLDQAGSSIALYFPTRWVAVDPGDPVANYLLGRRLLQGGEAELALPYLGQAVERMPTATLDAEAALMYVEALYFVGRLDEAARWNGALAKAELSYYEVQAEEWARRIDWKRRNTIESGRR